MQIPKGKRDESPVAIQEFRRQSGRESSCQNKGPAIDESRVAIRAEATAHTGKTYRTPSSSTVKHYIKTQKTGRHK